MTAQHIKLNPVTLQPDTNGRTYEQTIIGSSVILCAIDDTSEQQIENKEE